MTGLGTWGRAVSRAIELEEKKLQSEVDVWKTKIGTRVKHEVYLLTGVIVDVITVPVSLTPRIIVEWDNGAKSAEIPASLILEVS